MKHVYFYSFAILTLISFTGLKAQTSTDAEKKRLRENFLQHQAEKKKTATLASKTSASSSNSYPVMKLDENDQYMGREKEFLEIMVVPTLPSDFPKYNKSLGMAGYNNTIDYYFKQHPELLKDKWKQKIKNN